MVFAGADPLGTGHGATKQEAEKKDARAALQTLGGGTETTAASKPARMPRPRQRRAPLPRAVALPPNDAEASIGTTLTVMPDPEPPQALDAPAPVDEPGRSRQFGEPLDSSLGCARRADGHHIRSLDANLFL